MQQGATTSLEVRHATGQDGAIADVYAALSPMVPGYLRRFVPHDEAEHVLQREVPRLAYFGDCIQTQIAAHLGIPLGTVKARTFRGLRRLGRLLASDPQ